MSITTENKKLLKKLHDLCDGDITYLASDLGVKYHQIYYWYKSNKISDRGLKTISANTKYSKYISAVLQEYINVKCR